MKVAVLLLVVLGFVAFAQAAPSPTYAPAMELMESENEDQSVIDPNCDKAKKGEEGGDTADPESQAQKKEGKKSKKGGKGKKDKKKKDKDGEE